MWDLPLEQLFNQNYYMAKIFQSEQQIHLTSLAQLSATTASRSSSIPELGIQKTVVESELKVVHIFEMSFQISRTSPVDLPYRTKRRKIKALVDLHLRSIKESSNADNDPNNSDDEEFKLPAFPQPNDYVTIADELLLETFEAQHDCDQSDFTSDRTGEINDEHNFW